MQVKQKDLNYEKYLEYLFYITLFFILFIWSLMLRFNDAPDELGRYNICQYIFNHGRLPHGGDPEIRLKDWGFSYAFQPILPYILGGVLMKFTALFTSNAYFYIIAARFVSVACGVIMAVFVRKIAKRVFIDSKLQWIFTFLIMLLPQNMFMFVYINTDSMAIMSTAIIVYAWLYGLDSSWNYKACITLSVGLILCAMSYYNAYGFILGSIIIFAVNHISIHKNLHKLTIDWKNFLKKGLFISAIVLFGAGWWFIRNYFLYDGDLLGLHTRMLYGEKYAALEHLKPSNAKTYYNAGFSIFRMLRETDYIPLLTSSFIGRFGYMDIILHSWIYVGYAIIIGCGAVGLIFKKRNPITNIHFDTKNTVCLNICMIICIILPIYMCTASSYARDYQPQGRYILPMTVPFMYYITIGLKKLFDILIRNEMINRVVTNLFILWFFAVVFFFIKDMVFAFYWDAFVNFVKGLF